MSFASQVRATTELNTQNRPYLYPNFFGGNGPFLWQCPFLVAMPLFGGNAPFWWQWPFLVAMPLFGGNVPFWWQCPFLVAMALNLVSWFVIHHYMQFYLLIHMISTHVFITYSWHQSLLILAEIHL